MRTSTTANSKSSTKASWADEYSITREANRKTTYQDGLRNGGNADFGQILSGHGTPTCSIVCQRCHGRIA